METESEVNMAEDVTKQPAELRENLIETAIKFLQNPKVRQSPFPQRRTFLEKKGLTKEEIDAAIERSGTAQDEHNPPPQETPVPGSQQPGQVQPYVVQPPPQPVSAWSKARDYIATLVVIGGVGYAVYQLYKKYIYPIWFGPTQEQKQLADIRASVKELEGNIAETLKAIQEMQGSIKKQQDSLDTVVTTDMASRGNNEYKKMMDTQQVNEIKDEIKSLKGLLLTRNQFPAPPKTAPVLPSWQLEANNKQSQASPVATKVTGTSSSATEDDTVSDTQQGATATLTEVPVTDIQASSEEASPVQVNGIAEENGAVSESEENQESLSDTQTTSQDSDIVKEQAPLAADTQQQTAQ